MTTSDEGTGGHLPGSPGSSPAHPWATRGRVELAAAVRRLVELAVDAEVPAAALADAVAVLAPLAERLAAHVPAMVPHRSLGLVDTGDIDLSDPAALPDLHQAMPADIVVGTCNPLAPPLVVTTEGSVAVAVATFTRPYEGEPGLVHGGAIAAAFDLVLAAANRAAGATGPTTQLELAHHHPTVLGLPVRLEASVVRRDERRVVSEGRLLQAGTVTTTATGTFAVLTLDEIRNLLDRNRRPRRDRARPPG